MRVATFNILHGVPLRDVQSDAGGASGRRRRRTRNDPDEAPAAGGGPGGPPPFADEDLGEGLESLPDGIDPRDVQVGGADPTRRAQWSPTVSEPDELLRAIDELQADGPVDVIALQEVDLRQPRTALADQAALVAEAIGAADFRFVPAILGIPGIEAEGADWIPATAADDDPPLGQAPGSSTGGDPAAGPPDGPRYGVALISRYPVREWRVRRFPPAPMSLPLLAPNTGGRPRAIRVPDEPRAAVAAVIEAPNADLTFATAHLSFVPGYNTRQLMELRAFLAGMPRPMVLLGDFNTPGAVPGLVTGWDQVARVPTYPVMRPRVQFDHIMADGWTADAVAQARSSVRAIALPVSDHCALLADFPDL